MGIRLLRGRDFALSDIDGQPGVVIINQTLAGADARAGSDRKRIGSARSRPEATGSRSSASSADSKRSSPRGRAEAATSTCRYSSSRCRSWRRDPDRRRRSAAVAVGGAGRGARARSRAAGRRGAHHRADARARRPASRAFARSSWAPSRRWRCCWPPSASTGWSAYSVAHARAEIGVRLALGASPAQVGAPRLGRACGSRHWAC